jgi:decaprenyl-phosphate phosphoribosyltransferase
VCGILSSGRADDRAPLLEPGRWSDINSIELKNGVDRVWPGPAPAEPRPVAVAVRSSRLTNARTLLRACRPRQWTKNALLLAAPAAGGVIATGSVELRVAAAIVSFCLLSSATYLLNDVRDLEQDRLHPRKRHRPVAAGEMSPRTALAAAAVLGLGGLGIAAAVRPLLGLVGLGYLVLTATYSLWWRHVFLLDIVAVAGGFVVRAAAGGVAADVPLSRWFLVVTSLCAIFIVAGKRHAELIDGERAGPTRGTLRHYSASLLHTLLGAAAGGAVIAYAIWAFRRPESGPWYELTILPFVAALGRYGFLLGRGAGDAPEEVILHDWVLIVLGLVWMVLFFCGIYVGR